MIIISLLLFILPLVTFGHPIDISQLNLFIQGQHINGTLTLHSYQAQRLLSENDVAFGGVERLFDHEQIFQSYISDRLSFRDQESNPCPIVSVSLIPKDIPTLITQGVDFGLFAKCDTTIRALMMDNTLFNNFPLQTNRLTIFAGVGLQTEPFGYRILTAKRTQASFDFSQKKESCTDTDSDGLCDGDEEIFGTKIKLRDTDGDCYSDYEEIYNSRDPLSTDPSPGQASRTECAAPIPLQTASSSGTKGTFDPSQFITSTEVGTAYLTQTLQKIYAFTQSSSLPRRQVVLAMIILGMIHAIGPGHAKNIMASYLLDGKKTHRHGFLFSLAFAITHISDLFVLVIFVYFLQWLMDPAPYLPYIQFGSTIILFFYAIWMLIRAVRHFGQESDDDNDLKKGESIRHTLGVAFVSGLAPCTFGWSVFFLLFSLGRLDLLFPFLGALCLGIYITLQVIAIIIIQTKTILHSRLTTLAQRSGVLSFGLLVLISLWLMWGMRTQL
ncbi:MAG: hypothetical protein NZL83_01895 [Candidatus Absconditabacterales bacterium]|nr:hypothetical protein [Candidatus Absconditabacterales bacterium]